MSNPAVPKTAFWEQGEFWSMWLPTWLQAVGTLLAVWIAYGAFKNWRREEVARDVASSAKALVPSVHRLVVVTRSIRNPRATMHKPVKPATVSRAAERASKERLEELDQLLKVIKGQLEILGRG